jgi:hypothetical protein
MDIKKLLESLQATVKAKTVGEIKIIRVNLNDLVYCEDELKNLKDDREFVSKFIYHQLVEPKLTYEEFKNISDDELREIARAFTKLEDNGFRDFKETTDDEFFANFRNVFQKYYEKGIESLRNAVMPILETAKKTLEEFNKKHSGIIQQAMKQASFITDAVKEISGFTKVIRESQLKAIESIKPIVEQYQNTARIISEVMKPQIDIWQKWAEKNKALFDSYQNIWKELQDKYNVSEPEAIRILKKYKWFVSPSMPIGFIFEIVKIGRKKGNHRGDINRLFVNYFASKNYKNLEYFLVKWSKSEIFKPRMKIIRDCFFAMKNAKRTNNPSNTVLPTLVAQIDGIQREFMKKRGLSFDVRNRKWKDVTGKDVNWNLWFRSHTSNQKLMDLANDIFLNILFQKSQPGEPLETPFTFNRHKILHGEYVNYGRIDNTIRAFLILDFLAHLK